MKRLCSGNIENLANEMLNETYFLGSMFDLQNKLKVNLKNLEGISEYAHQLSEEEFKNEVKKYLDDLQNEYDEFTLKLNELRNSL